MTTKIKYAFWLFFGISIFLLLLSAGLFLVVSAIVLLPILILHIVVGRKIENLKKYNWLIIISILNLVLFALIRPDGTHTTTNIGLSALLDLLGIYGGFNPAFEDYYFTAAFIIITIQVVIDLTLYFFSKK